MPITAKFLADFNAFRASVAAAEGSLKNLEGGAAKLGTTFDTVKGIATTLAGAFGIAFSVGAAVRFGQALADDAGALVDLRAKTGASLEQLQRWAFVGDQAGVSTDQFADASFKLGVALAGGSKSVKGAIDDLGLSYANLRTLSPDAQFNAVVKALESMESPQERNRVALELFGRSFASIAPAVVAGYTAMAAAAKVSSDGQIEAIDRASDAFSRWVKDQKTAITSGIGSIILLHEAVAKLPEGYATFLLQTNKSIKSIEQLDAALIEAASAADIVLPSTKKVADEIDRVATVTSKAATAIKTLTDEEIALATAIKAHWTDVGTILDRVLGVAQLKVAGDWADAIDALGGSVASLSQKDLAELDTAMADALDVMARNGTLTEAVSSRYQELAIKAQAAALSFQTVSAAVLPATDALYDFAVAVDAEFAALRRANDETAKVPALYEAASSAKQAFLTGPGIPSTGLTVGPGGILMPSDWGGNIGIPGSGAGHAISDNIGAFGNAGPLRNPLIGTGAGTLVTNHFYVNGTAADVARQVAAEIVRTMKQGHQFGTS